jgi:hypothetical protein
MAWTNRCQVLRGEAEPDDALTGWAELYDELISPGPSPAGERYRSARHSQEAARKLGTQPWALFPVPGIRVRLTDLGKYVVRERLAAGGAQIPQPN